MDSDYSWVANISPYVATVVGTVAVVLGYLKFKSLRIETNAKNAAQSQLDNIQSTTTGSDTKIAALALKVDSVQLTLATHVLQEDASRNAQTDVLKEIHKQLVNLNASMTGSVINQENAKLIIGYQWNWCRDETVRVVLRSIKDNHFKGNESVVARNVYRGWNKAAKDALASLVRIEGLSYPHSPLFLRHVEYIWSTVWSWAIPLYYDKNRSTISFDSKLADLSDRITALFDSVLESHVDVAEDVAIGALYRDDHPSTEVGVMFDENFATRMGDKLRNFSNSDDASNRTHNPSVSSIRSVVQANIDGMYKRKNNKSDAGN